MSRRCRRAGLAAATELSEHGEQTGRLLERCWRSPSTRSMVVERVYTGCERECAQMSSSTFKFLFGQRRRDVRSRGNVPVFGSILERARLRVIAVLPGPPPQDVAVGEECVVFGIEELHRVSPVLDPESFADSFRPSDDGTLDYPQKPLTSSSLPERTGLPSSSSPSSSASSCIRADLTEKHVRLLDGPGLNPLRMTRACGRKRG